jgi:hypothetical protein
MDGIEFELVGGPLDGREVKMFDDPNANAYLLEEWRDHFLDDIGCLKAGLIPLYVQLDDAGLLYFRFVDYQPAEQ